MQFCSITVFMKTYFEQLSELAEQLNVPLDKAFTEAGFNSSQYYRWKQNASQKSHKTASLVESAILELAHVSQADKGASSAL